MVILLDFCEVGYIIKILNLNIAIYKEENNNTLKFYKFLAYFHEDNSEYKRDLMILLYDDSLKHYNHLYYNNDYKFNNINHNKDIGNNNNINSNYEQKQENNIIQFNTDIEKEIKALILKYKNINLNSTEMNKELENENILS